MAKDLEQLSIANETYDVKDKNAVHKSGDERIEGTKTFASPVSLEESGGVQSGNNYAVNGNAVYNAIGSAIDANNTGAVLPAINQAITNYDGEAEAKFVKAADVCKVYYFSGYSVIDKALNGTSAQTIGRMFRVGNGEFIVVDGHLNNMNGSSVNSEHFNVMNFALGTSSSNLFVARAYYPTELVKLGFLNNVPYPLYTLANYKFHLAWQNNTGSDKNIYVFAQGQDFTAGSLSLELDAIRYSNATVIPNS